MSSIDDVLIHNLALVLSVEGLSSRIGHKKISATDIANDVNDYFKENGLDRSVNANLLGHCLSSFKSKLFNDAKLKQKKFNFASLNNFDLKEDKQCPNKFAFTLRSSPFSLK